MADRSLAERITARIGHQPVRSNVWDASLVKLAMAEADGDLIAGACIDNLLDYLRGEK